MRKTLILIAMLTLSACGSRWQEFSSTESGFTIRMPGRPSEQQSVQKTKDGPVIERTYIFQPHGSVLAYGVEVMTFPASFQPADIDTYLVRVHQAYAVKYKGQMMNKRSIMLDGHPGIEVEMTWSQGHEISRTYWVKSRLLGIF